MTVTGKFDLDYCVWELTLACDAHCIHCGSTAGKRREAELDTTEALAVIDDLARLECGSVTLSGGEPMMREDWPELAAAIVGHGIRLEMITNGMRLREQVETISKAAFYGVTASIDGPEAIHDKLRGTPGGLVRIFEGIDALKKSGVRVGAVTQINHANLSSLHDIAALLEEHNVDGWQLQLTMPHGRAASGQNELCLAPGDLQALEQAIAELKQRSTLHINVGDNIGYFGPAEPQLRTPRGESACVWSGCEAGLSVVGITSDGWVRGCLSLPPRFNEDNVRHRSICDIWHDTSLFGFNRAFRADSLEGACGKCPLGRLCRGGCTSQGVAMTGSPFKNPMCTRALAEGFED